MHDIRWQKAPRPWTVVETDRGGVPLAVAIGGRRVSLSRVGEWRVEGLSEHNIDAHLATAALFMIGGALFALAVVLELASPRFLLGSALFIAIGLTALGELTRTRPIEVMRVSMALSDGEILTFTTVDPAEADALAAVLRVGTPRQASG